VEAQIARARAAGVAGYLVSILEIDQSWEPRIVKTAGLSAAPGRP